MRAKSAAGMPDSTVELTAISIVLAIVLAI